MADLVGRFIAWSREQPRLNYQFAVCLKARPSMLIGCAGLRQAGRRAGEAELGIELAPDFWGRHRYALEITQAPMGFGFGALHLERIVGSTVDANHVVSRLAEWLDAQVRETRDRPEWMQLRGCKQVIWEVTPASWNASRGLSRGSDR